MRRDAEAGAAAVRCVEERCAYHPRASRSRRRCLVLAARRAAANFIAPEHRLLSNVSTVSKFEMITWLPTGSVHVARGGYADIQSGYGVQQSGVEAKEIRSL